MIALRSSKVPSTRKKQTSRYGVKISTTGPSLKAKQHIIFIKLKMIERCSTQRCEKGANTLKPRNSKKVTHVSNRGELRLRAIIVKRGPIVE